VANGVTLTGLKGVEMVTLRAGYVVMAGSLLGGELAAQTTPTRGPITRVDHFYVESLTAEALLQFLRNDLELPVAWPYRNYGSFASGAVSLGNVNFEIVRFQQAAERHSTNFAGIALEPRGDTEDAVAWLNSRDVAYSKPRPFPADGPAFWENTLLPGLIPGTATVFICDYKDRQWVLDAQRVSQAVLVERGGGPLGISAARELVIESADLARSLEMWSKVIPSTREVGREIHVDLDHGPRIRIQSGASDRFAMLVLSVRSIGKARAFLEARDLVGPLIGNALTIDSKAVEGLQILLVEGT
jgi:hypothetical protein